MNNRMTQVTIVAEKRKCLAVLVIAGVLALGGGCAQENEGNVARRPPVAFEPDNECHVCGMLIARFPGPKGEAFVSRRDQPLKFCSTKDLFAWLLQPEARAIVSEIYVHDMAQSDWASPDDTHLIDARSAWYVVGSERQGAMGPTLASFAQRGAAQDFAGRHGGRLLRFEEVDLSVLEALILAH